MRTILLISVALPALLIAGCDRAPSREAADNAASADAASEAAAPDIPVSVTPGVAFDFRYAFSLPEKSIATVQEAHAAQCARLGIVHCRVTGVLFTKARDGETRASMTFKLDPAMALGFARDATVLVERSGGSLATSNVTGEDVGSGIVANDKSADAVRAELAKIDAQLRIPGLSKTVRSNLVERSNDLRDQLRDLARDRDAKVESLATTPVAFDYETATAVGLEAPVKQGLSASTASITALLSFLALAMGAVGPWAVLVAAVWWLIARLRRTPASDTAA